MLKKLSLFTALIGLSVSIARADTFKTVQASTSGAPQAGMAGYAVNLPSATFTNMISTRATGEFTQMSNRGKTVYDRFNRSNRLLTGDRTPTGDTWVVSGVGVSTTQIQQGVVTSTQNYYADIDYGTQIPKICGAFSFIPSTNAAQTDQSIKTLAMHMDSQQIGLNTMLHLQIGVQGWGLDFYDHGSVISALSGGYNLQMDGTIYGVCIEVNGSSVTVRPPQGPAQTYTNNIISTTTYRYGTWQYTATNLTPVGRWHGILMDNINSISDVDRALGMGKSINDNVYSVVALTSATINDARFSSATVSNLLALNATSITGSLMSGTAAGIAIQGTNTNDSAAAGKYFETVSSQTTNSVNGSNGAFVNFVSTVIAAGDWWCSGGIRLNANSDTDTGWQVAISINSGDTTTDHVAGVNNIINSYTSFVTDTNNFTPMIPPYEIKATGNTPVYLKFRWNFTGGTPVASSGGLFCHRAR